ncbi:hypothetical protein QKT26_gp61 [Carcinus maenas nudivirus]|uniref:Uncharacterized protein n=1 Tax=Carcinus maenas nudivirus TaxID=2880837 RepID=A0AAE8Y0U4_9VIRU|nr:hypothetical protein QKT26_gp61 [Carcinus maenas nudivirus]UBZ25651.1 hypothetical protein CmNV_060 [Carcinus maenas nudivirus]
MPKRKLTSQYAPKEKKKEECDTDMKIKKTDISKVDDIGNSTNIGELYINALQDSNTVEEESQLYIGNRQYNISTKFNPIEIFNDYFIKIMNSICGYCEDQGLSVEQIKSNPTYILVQAFLSILYFNNIIIPSNIFIRKHENNILLGECIYYNKCYEKNELNIDVSNKLVMNFITNEENFDIVLSSKINNEQYSIKDNLQKYKEDFVLTDDVHKYLVALFVLADHAATHYIEEYVSGTTDWVHHFNFAKGINTFILINTIFKISANISNLDVTPKLSIENKNKPISNESIDVDKLFVGGIGLVETINSVDLSGL